MFSVLFFFQGNNSSYLSKNQFKGSNMKDIFVDDWELDKEFTDENFKAPKDALRDEQINQKQIYYRYSHCSERVNCRNNLESEATILNLFESCNSLTIILS